MRLAALQPEKPLTDVRVALMRGQVKDHYRIMYIADAMQNAAIAVDKGEHTENGGNAGAIVIDN